jgi:SAM-dependent methyltransferase
VDKRHRESAASVRWAIEHGLHDPSTFRATVLHIPPTLRDAWFDLVLGLGELPEDGPELPRGCVPYLPCSVNSLLRMVDQARVRPSDVFVDVGAGLGRAAVFVHLLTGAPAIGIEVQRALVLAARDLAARFRLSRVPCIEGDAATLIRYMTIGTVFFLYCPFSGERLDRVLDELESIAHTRTIRVCCADVPLPPRAWLTPESDDCGDLVIYRSTIEWDTSSPDGPTGGLFNEGGPLPR